jgi:hypothetical protein
LYNNISLGSCNNANIRTVCDLPARSCRPNGCHGNKRPTRYTQLSKLLICLFRSKRSAGRRRKRRRKG